MNLVPYTWNGTALRDSNYYAWFPRGSVMLHSGVDPVILSREHASPKLSYKNRAPAKWQLHIRLLGTPNTQIDTIKELFDPYLADTGADSDLATLICTDAANGDKQWQVSATVLDIVQLDGQDLVISLLVPNPIWKSVTQTTTTLNATTSGSTTNVIIAGNQPSPPVIRITPTAPKAILSSDKYTRGIYIYNQTFDNYEVPFSSWPMDITNGGIDTSALIADTTISNAITTTVTSTSTTWTISTAVGGGLPNAGMGYIGTEQISWTTNGGSSLSGITRGIGGTTAATHASGAVINYSHMMANGDDIRINVNGADANIWFGTGSYGMNSTQTRIWTNINLQPNYATNTYYKLNAAIAGSGSVSTVTLNLFKAAAGNGGNGPLDPFGRSWSAPAAGYFMIGTEAFAYLGKNPASGQFTGVTRAALGTTTAAHSIGDIVYLLPNVIWMITGNGSASTRVTDDTHKPLIDLSTSGNTKFYFNGSFSDIAGLRAVYLTSAITDNAAPLSARKSTLYRSSQTTTDGTTNPASASGASLANWLKGSKWQTVSGTVQWNFYSPPAIQTVGSTGYKYATTTTAWPNGGVGMGTTITTVPNIWSESAPTTAATWQAFTHSGSSTPGTSYHSIYFYMNGALPRGAGYVSAYEMDTLTVNFYSTSAPAIVVGSETAMTAAGYALNMRITNNTSGEYFDIQAMIDLNKTLEIDCENKTIKYLYDNSFIACTFTKSSVRHDWLNLSVGTNEIAVTENGLSGVTVAILTNDRNS